MGIDISNILKIAFILTITIIIITVVNIIINNYIKRNSEKYNKIISLNEKYTFDYDIPSLYEYTKSCNSLKQYRNIDYDKILREYIHKNLREIVKVKGKLDLQQFKYGRYKEDINSIGEKYGCKGNKLMDKLYIKKENKLCKKIELNPVVDIDFKIKAYYTSPKGRNHYEDMVIVNIGDVSKWIEKITVNEEYGVIETTPEKLLENRVYMDNKKGVYSLYNLDKKKYYVGQGENVIERASMHFSGKGNFDVNFDYANGDRFKVEIRYLDGSGFKNLNDMERHYISYYDSYSTGYNRTRGNS